MDSNPVWDIDSHHPLNMHFHELIQMSLDNQIQALENCQIQALPGRLQPARGSPSKPTYHLLIIWRTLQGLLLMESSNAEECSKYKLFNPLQGRLVYKFMRRSMYLLCRPPSELRINRMHC
jgi:hypothetical protein